jgi:hypothetical protein
MTVSAGQAPECLNFVAKFPACPDLPGGASTSLAQDTGLRNVAGNLTLDFAIFGWTGHLPPSSINDLDRLFCDH